MHVEGAGDIGSTMPEKKFHPVLPTMRSLLNLTYMQTAEDNGPMLGKDAGEI